MTPTPNSPRTIFEVIARFIRKAIRFIFKTIGAAALAAIILAILLPPAAFAIRSTLPMNNPLFNNLSFYQVTRLRYNQYRDFVTKYNTTHPSDAGISSGACFWTEVARSLTNALLAEVCTLAKCSGLIVVPTGLGTYPTAIWGNFEDNLIYEFDRAPQQPVGACRLPPNFPLPENPSTGE